MGSTSSNSVNVKTSNNIFENSSDETAVLRYLFGNEPNESECNENVSKLKTTEIDPKPIRVALSVFDYNNRSDKNSTNDRDDEVDVLKWLYENEPSESECSEDINKFKHSASKLDTGGIDIKPDSTDTTLNTEGSINIGNYPDTSTSTEASLSVGNNPHPSSNTATIMSGGEYDPDRPESVISNNITFEESSESKTGLSRSEYESDTTENPKDLKVPSATELNTSTTTDSDSGAYKLTSTTIDVPASTFDIQNSALSSATASSVSASVSVNSSKSNTTEVKTTNNTNPTGTIPKTGFTFETPNSEASKNPNLTNIRSTSSNSVNVSRSNASDIPTSKPSGLIFGATNSTGAIPKTNFCFGILNSEPFENADLKNSAVTTNSTGSIFPASTDSVFLTPRTAKSISTDSLSTESSSGGSYVSGGTVSEESSTHESNSSGYGSPALPFTATCDIIQKPLFSFQTPKFEPLNKTVNSSASTSSLYGKPPNWNTGSATPNNNNATFFNGTNATASKSGESTISATKFTGEIPKTTYSFGIPSTEASKSMTLKNSLSTGFSFEIPSSGTFDFGSKPTTTVTNASVFGAANSTVTTTTDTIPKTGFTFKTPDLESSETKSLISAPTDLSFGTPSDVSSKSTELKPASSNKNSNKSNEIDVTTSKLDESISDATNLTLTKPKKTVCFGTVTFGAPKPTESLTNDSDSGATVSSVTNSSETTTEAIPKTSFGFGIPNSGSSKSISTESSTNKSDSGAIVSGVTNSSETTSGAIPKTSFGFGIPNSGSSKSISTESSTNKSNSGATVSSVTNSSETTSGAIPKTSFGFGITNSGSSQSISTESSTNKSDSGATVTSVTNSSETISGAIPKTSFGFGIPNSGSSKSISTESSTNKSNSGATVSGATNSSETTSGAIPKTNFCFGIPNSGTSKSISTESSTNKSNSGATVSGATNSSEPTSNTIPNTTFSFGTPNVGATASTSTEPSTNKSNSGATVSGSNSGTIPKTTFSYGIPNSESSKSTSTESSTNKSNSGAKSFDTTPKPKFSFGIPTIPKLQYIPQNHKTNTTKSSSAPMKISIGIPNTSTSTVSFGIPTSSTPVCDFASNATNIVKSFKTVICKPSEFSFGNSQGVFGIGTGFFGSQKATAMDWSGTGVVRYKPVRDVDVGIIGTTSQNISVNICVISAMREYEKKSIEELRYEDYMAGRKGHSKHACRFCTADAICVYDENYAPLKPPSPTSSTFGRMLASSNRSKGISVAPFTVPSSSNVVGTPSTNNRGTGVIRYRPTTDEERCNICVISVMKEYETKSLDELRYEDYIAKRQGRSTHKCAFCPSDYFCTFDKKYNNKPPNNIPPNASTFGTPSGSKSAFPTNSIFSAPSTKTSPFGTPASNSPFGTPASNTPFATLTSNIPFGTPASNSPFDTPASNISFGTPASNISFGTPASNSPFGAHLNNGPFGKPANNGPFGAPANNSPFGAPARTSSFGTLINGPFGGTSSNNKNAPIANKTLFGSTTNPNTSVFGTPSTAFNAPSTTQSVFGSPSAGINAPSTSKSVFGTPSTAFNAPSTTQSVFESPSTSINAPSTSKSVFGTPSMAFNAPSTTQSVFGSPSAGTNAPSTSKSVFGTPSTAFNAPSTTQSVFESPSTSINAPSTSKSLFETLSAGINAPSTSKGIFGSPSTEINAPSTGQSVFGTPSFNNSPNSNITFGAATTNNSVTKSPVLFGFTNNSIKIGNPKASLYGTPSTGTIFEAPSNNNCVTTPSNVSTFGVTGNNNTVSSISQTSTHINPSFGSNSPIVSHASQSTIASTSSGTFRMPSMSEIVASSNSMSGIGAPSINSISGIRAPSTNSVIGVGAPYNNCVSGIGAPNNNGVSGIGAPSTYNVSGINAPCINTNQLGSSNLLTENQEATSDGIDGNSSSCPYPYIPNNSQINSGRSRFGETTTGNRVAGSTGGRIATTSSNRMANTSGNDMANSTGNRVLTTNYNNMANTGSNSEATTSSNSIASTSNRVAAAIGNNMARSSSNSMATSKSNIVASTSGNRIATSDLQSVATGSSIHVPSTSNQVAAAIGNNMANTSSNSMANSSSNSMASTSNIVASTTGNRIATNDFNTGSGIRVPSTSNKPIGATESTSEASGNIYSLINTLPSTSQIRVSSTPNQTYQHIPSNLISRWDTILKTGLSEFSKHLLQQEYSVPENIALLKAPILNPEIGNNDQMTEDFKNIDNKLQKQQDLLGNGIVALIKAMDFLLDEENIPQAIRALFNSTRLLSDLHFKITEERVKNVFPLLEESVCDVLRERERDATIFGSDMSERVDATNMFKRSNDIEIREVENANNGSDVSQTEMTRMFQLLESNISNLKTEILTKIDKLSERVDEITHTRETDNESNSLAASSENDTGRSSPLDEQFQPGNYVILKSDLKWKGVTLLNKPEKFDIYKVVSSKLLNKYECRLSDQRDGEVYEQTKTYTDWSKKRSGDFYSISDAVRVRGSTTDGCILIYFYYDHLYEVLHNAKLREE